MNYKGFSASVGVFFLENLKNPKVRIYLLVVFQYHYQSGAEKIRDKLQNCDGKLNLLPIQSAQVIR